MIFKYFPSVVRILFPESVICSFPSDSKELFLTFDDGPEPKVTEYILHQLDRFKAKATFFCIGDNIRKAPELYREIIEQKHSIGNHTFNHINGWKHSLSSYLNNIEMCEKYVHTKLFRPPYGKMNPFQLYKLSKMYYIILWTEMPGDYAKKISAEKCYLNLIKQSHKEGAIIVLHDSQKALIKLKYVLPKFLEYFSEKSYKFSAITEKLCELYYGKISGNM